MNWIEEPSGQTGKNNLTLTVPIKQYFGIGEYIIHIQPRPSYCDRGDWVINIEGANDIDASDGFPRYFFGTEKEVKKQMETWLSKREAYQKTL